jgi:hypothetical protein
MFGFLFGWGVFWLLIWASVFTLSFMPFGAKPTDSDYKLRVAGILGLFVSAFWIMAVSAGRLVS